MSRWKTLQQPRRSGFTLLEMIVVIGVVSVMFSMLLSALQSAREGARRTSCRNHLAQLAKGMIQHESQHRYFPTGGWSENWLGTPDRASDSSQPGGWTFTVLPYIEEVALQDGVLSAADAQTAYEQLCEAPVASFGCPSRRGGEALAGVDNEESGVRFRTSFGGNDATVTITQATRCDYAASGGSMGACIEMPIKKFIALVGTGGSGKVRLAHRPPGNPSNCNEILVPVSALSGHANHPHDTIGRCDTSGPCTEFMDAILYAPTDLDDGDEKRRWRKSQRISQLGESGVPDLQDGMVDRMGKVQAGAVLDGLSNVYLIAEKYVRADGYDGGVDRGDDSILYAGYSASNVRWASEPPQSDADGEEWLNAFGSAHAEVWNAAFGDGSVRSMSYDIDPEVHKNLAAKTPRFEGEVLGNF